LRIDTAIVCDNFESRVRESREIFPQRVRDQRKSFRFAKKIFCALASRLDKIVKKMRKNVIACVGFQSKCARSRERSEFSRASRAIARAKNFLFDPRA
jgi:hypothetical protein